MDKEMKTFVQMGTVTIFGVTKENELKRKKKKKCTDDPSFHAHI